VSGLRIGPPKQQVVQVQNVAGVTLVTDIQVVNGAVDVAAFTPGTTGPIVVTATRANQTLGTNWSFDVIYTFGTTGRPPDDLYRARNSCRSRAVGVGIPFL
jgi:hypothetical protein